MKPNVANEAKNVSLFGNFVQPFYFRFEYRTAAIIIRSEAMPTSGRAKSL